MQRLMLLMAVALFLVAPGEAEAMEFSLSLGEGVSFANGETHVSTRLALLAKVAKFERVSLYAGLGLLEPHHGLHWSRPSPRAFLGDTVEITKGFAISNFLIYHHALDNSKSCFGISAGFSKKVGNSGFYFGLDNYLMWYIGDHHGPGHHGVTIQPKIGFSF